MFVRMRSLLMNLDGGGGFGGGDGGNGNVTASEGSSFSAAPDGGNQPLISQNPLLDPNYGQQPTMGQAPTEELDFAGRKVKVIDPVIKDIHKDYSSLQRTYQETNQQMKQLQEQNQMFQQVFQMLQQQGNLPASQQQGQSPQSQQFAPQPPSQEEIDSFMNEWYENPIQTFDQMISKRIESAMEQQVRPMIEPIQRERQYAQEIQGLNQKYPDFQELTPAMKDVIEQYPHLADQGLETVYLVAKGQVSQQPPITPEQMMSDPQFRQQVMQNEQIRNEMISQYMQQRQQTNSQAPPLMGNQPGGQIPAMPENQPKTLREASKMFSRYLGIN